MVLETDKNPLVQMNTANLQAVQPSAFFVLIHINVAFSFFLNLVYKTSEFQGQCAIARVILMDLYMGQQIAI